MAQLGQTPQAIPKNGHGVPVWPDGLVGSLAHDSRVAAAALASRRDFTSLGIDVEPADPLDPDLIGIVATADERRAIGGDLLQARLLFAIKEAVYKCVYPLDGEFLDHHDVAVSIASGEAITRGGRTVPFRTCIAGHILVLAYC